MIAPVSRAPAHGGVLRADRVSVRYGRIDALQPVSLAVETGGLVLVLGPNGAGKTTLLKALAGMVPLRSGRVVLNGREIGSMPAHRRVRHGISLVPEGRGRLPGLSVQENLDLGWSAAAPERQGDRRTEMARILALFPELADRLEQDCSTLSGGQMQMLAIGRALLAKPLVLLLDEPSLGLAPLAVERVYEALAALNAQGLAMVLVEQKAVSLPALRENTMVLRNGRIVFQRDRRPSADELAQLYLGGKAA